MSTAHHVLIAVALCGCGEPIRDFLTGGGDAISTVFLSYEGTVLIRSAGEDATQDSSLLVPGRTSFARYRGGDPDRAQKLVALTDEISAILAPYDVFVTATRPATGAYNMIVFTDDTGEAVGCANCISSAPGFCDTPHANDSQTGLVFGGSLGGIEMPPHMATLNAIAIFGTFANIPTSSVAGDCMCYADTVCVESAMTMTSACTIGGAGTPLSSVQKCFTDGQTTMDEHAEFLEVYGSSM